MNRITFAKDVQALYIYLTKGKVAYTKQYVGGVMVDFDKKHDVVGIEIINPVLLKSLKKKLGS